MIPTATATATATVTDTDTEAVDAGVCNNECVDYCKDGWSSGSKWRRFGNYKSHQCINGLFSAYSLLGICSVACFFSSWSVLSCNSLFGILSIVSCTEHILLHCNDVIHAVVVMLLCWLMYGCMYVRIDWFFGCRIVWLLWYLSAITNRNRALVLILVLTTCVFRFRKDNNRLLRELQTTN